MNELIHSILMALAVLGEQTINCAHRAVDLLQKIGISGHLDINKYKLHHKELIFLQTIIMTRALYSFFAGLFIFQSFTPYAISQPIVDHDLIDYISTQAAEVTETSDRKLVSS